MLPPHLGAGACPPGEGVLEAAHRHTHTRTPTCGADPGVNCTHLVVHADQYLLLSICRAPPGECAGSCGGERSDAGRGLVHTCWWRLLMEGILRCSRCTYNRSPPPRHTTDSVHAHPHAVSSRANYGAHRQLCRGRERDPSPRPAASGPTLSTQQLPCSLRGQARRSRRWWQTQGGLLSAGGGLRKGLWKEASRAARRRRRRDV